MSQSEPKLHTKADGRQFVKCRATGGKPLYFGKKGDPQTLAKYGEWLKRFAMSPTKAEPSKSSGVDRPISSLIAMYLSEMRLKHTKEGELKRHFRNICDGLQHLEALHGSEFANEFTGRKLKDVMHAMNHDGLCRKVINKRLGLIKAFWKWCALNSEQTGVHQEFMGRLMTVEGFSKGTYNTRESQEVMAVSLDVVEATLPFLDPVVASMVRTQLFTGMRSGEVCQVRMGDIEIHGDSRIFKPDRHKGQWINGMRAVLLPPIALEILEPFFRPGEPMAYLFSPQDAERFRLATREPKPRKSKCFPSEKRRMALEKSRRTRLWETKPECYTTKSYYRAIYHAIHERAPAAGVTIEHWKPHQIRHATVNQVQRATNGNVQTAQRYVGHKDMATTATYNKLQTDEIIEIGQTVNPLWKSKILKKHPGIAASEGKRVAHARKRMAEMEAGNAV